MSSINKFLSILTVALALVTFSTFTMAQETTTTAAGKPVKRMKAERTFGRDQMSRKMMGRHRGMRGGAMLGLRGLELTDVQKEQIKTIMQSNRPDQATMEEFRTLGKAKRDGTITTEQQARLTALRTQSTERAKSVHTQVEAVLTAEQKAKIETRKQEMRLRFDNRRPPRKPRPGPPATDKPVIK